MFITTAKKHKKGLQCDRAEKNVNYQRKAKIFLSFRFKLTERDQLRTAARISVLSCKLAKTFFAAKKLENSVVQQQNSKKVLLSQIELKSVTWPKKDKEGSFCSRKVETVPA